MTAKPENRTRLVGRIARLLVPLAMIAASAAAAPPTVPRADRAPEVRLSGDRVVLPFVMVREYPFVEGAVAGVKGKFLLDTGDDMATALNDHRIPLTGGTPIGTGHFGSGQSFEIRLNPAVSDVRMGPLHFDRVTQVQSQDARELEHITPDFLGWIGYRAWQGYALKLDYARGLATFYKGPPETYLAGEKVLGVIPYDVGKLPNNPMVRLRIGGVEATALFDTGQYGALWLDAATEARLLANGAIKPGSKADTFDLAGLDIGGRRRPGIAGMEISPDPFGPADAIGTQTRTVLTLGYGFLRQYKTVWDFERHRIYLLAR